MLKQFKIYSDKTGKLLFEGTAKECSKKYKVKERVLRAAASRGLRMCQGKYRAVDCSDLAETVTAYDNRDLIESWDRLCEPLRKKYGIPVYKAPKEDRR